MNYDILLGMANAIRPICTASVFVLSAWFITRTLIKKSEGKRDIILAALEKKPDMDVSDLINGFQSGTALLKEKLLRKLLWGCIFTFAGLFGFIGLLIAAIVGGAGNEDVYVPLTILAAPALAVGISFLLNYSVGRKMLAREIEAEERQRLAR